MAGRSRLPRRVHPVAWWVWAAGLATAASRTDNPLLLVAVMSVTVVVVAAREDPQADAPLGMFLALGLVAVGLRVVLGAALGGGSGTTVLLDLPRLALPEPVDVHLGGPVTAEGVVASACQGLQLAAMLATVGAANALASPRRLLRHVPATLYDVGTAVVVALSFAPRMVVEARAVRAARRLRGHDGHGPRELARTLTPVLEASFDRSLELAASMEARGYGRRTARTGRSWSSGLAVVGLLGLLAGLYALLDGSRGGHAWPVLLVGIALSGASLALGARADARTRYRPDPWGGPEWAVTLLGGIPASVLAVLASRQDPSLTMGTSPLSSPALAPAALAAILVAAGAAAAAPPLPRLPHEVVA